MILFYLMHLWACLEIYESFSTRNILPGGKKELLVLKELQQSFKKHLVVSKKSNNSSPFIIRASCREAKKSHLFSKCDEQQIWRGAKSSKAEYKIPEEFLVEIKKHFKNLKVSIIYFLKRNDKQISYHNSSEARIFICKKVELLRNVFVAKLTAKNDHYSEYLVLLRLVSSDKCEI